MLTRFELERVHHRNCWLVNRSEITPHSRPISFPLQFTAIGASSIGQYFLTRLKFLLLDSFTSFLLIDLLLVVGKFIVFWVFPSFLLQLNSRLAFVLASELWHRLLLSLAQAFWQLISWKIIHLHQCVSMILSLRMQPSSLMSSRHPQGVLVSLRILLAAPSRIASWMSLCQLVKKKAC